MSDAPADPRATAGRTSDRDDAGLIEGLRRKDHDAMATLYDRYGRYAFALAYRVVGEATEAEDVVQESFLTLWRQSGRLDAARGSVRSLLLTIVHRRSIDVVRRRTRRGRPADGEVLESLPAATPDPLEQASLAEQASCVRGALRELPEEQRQAVELTYFGGLTIAEMAQRQGIPLGTAKSRLRLAFGRLREQLRTLETRG